MTSSPYKGIKIKTDLMEESGKMMLLSEKLSDRYKTIEKYLHVAFHEDFVGLEEYLTDTAIVQVKNSIGEIFNLDNKLVTTDVRINFESGKGEEHCFCVPRDSANYTIKIQVSVSDLNKLDCIQLIEFNSTGKISSIRTYKLCTKN
jgi:hypothetical protein